MRIGTLLHDNDPRRQHRILEVTGHGVTTTMGLERVHARPVGGGREVSIACRRIYQDGRLRARGFSVLADTERASRPESMRALIGKPVWILRGSRGRNEGPGCFREVRAMLDDIEGELVHATLLQDDPHAVVGPYKTGEQGIWHGRSFVRPLNDRLEGANRD